MSSKPHGAESRTVSRTVPRTAVVIGATGGIGHATVDALVAADWRVIACSRNGVDFRLDAGEHAGQILESVEVDLGNAYSVQQAAYAIAQSVGETDAIINCAGGIRMEPVTDMAPESWHQIVNVNLTGVYHLAHYMLPLLRDNGSFVVVGAQSERLRLPGMGAYVAAKAGLEAFMATLSKEARKQKIALLRPGAVDTPFWEHVPLRLPKSALQPATVAERLRTIVEEGESGVIDL